MAASEPGSPPPTSTVLRNAEEGNPVAGPSSPPDEPANVTGETAVETDTRDDALPNAIETDV